MTDSNGGDVFNRSNPTDTFGLGQYCSNRRFVCRQMLAFRRGFPFHQIGDHEVAAKQSDAKSQDGASDCFRTE